MNKLQGKSAVVSKQRPDGHKASYFGSRIKVTSLTLGVYRASPDVVKKPRQEIQENIRRLPLSPLIS